jgi:hypothetical protein
LSKFLAVTIALATAGAQVVCACPSGFVLQQPKPLTIKACAGEKECCRTAQPSKPGQPPKQERCNICNLKHRAEQAMPDRHDSVVTLHPALWIAAPSAAEVAADFSVITSPAAVVFTHPPLLKDLFHVHSLLLN